MAVLLRTSPRVSTSSTSEAAIWTAMIGPAVEVGLASMVAAGDGLLVGGVVVALGACEPAPQDARTSTSVAKPPINERCILVAPFCARSRSNGPPCVQRPARLAATTRVDRRAVIFPSPAPPALAGGGAAVDRSDGIIERDGYRPPGKLPRR